MPMGPSLVGVASFVAIKFAGYSAAGIYANKHYPEAAPVHPAAFGAFRTVLGIAVGVSFAFAASAVDLDYMGVLWFVSLVPIRCFEWWLTLWFFFERKLQGRNSPRLWNCCAAGVGWSFVLDLPAIGSVFVVPGGMWIC
jgi:hypothetical protein